MYIVHHCHTAYVPCTTSLSSFTSLGDVHITVLYYTMVMMLISEKQQTGKKLKPAELEKRIKYLTNEDFEFTKEIIDKKMR